MSRGKMADWSADDLERAAKYMRELDSSSNARAAIELAKREQDVEIARHNAAAKEAEANRALAASQLERVRGEEQRKNLEAKRDSEKNLMDYKLQREQENLHAADQLARKRDADKRKQDLEDERVRAAIRRQAEEEIQAERRRSDEHRARLERENMRARAIAEAEGRIKEQRDNEDVFARQLQLKADADRVTRLESIASTFKHLGDSLTSFIMDKQKVTATVGALTALAAGVYITREGSRVAAAVLQKRLLTPALVRETSRSTGHFNLRHRAARLLGKEEKKEGYSLSDVVLRQDVASRVANLATAVKNTRVNGAPYRHLLFYGPPGTGKTMVAKRLARASGMEYAIMSGGDVGPLGKEGVTQLHKLFDWAEASPKGVVLFIDEADAFLASRSKTNMSEETRNALNAVLYRTGEASKKLMMVLATNRPGDLDAAVTDRVDESLVFGLPDLPARRALVAQYFDKLIRHAGDEAKGGLFSFFAATTAKISLAPELTDEDEAGLKALLEEVAGKTEGFSGRAISKLLLSVQGEVYGRSGGKAGAPPLLTADLFREVLGWKMAENEAKHAFGSAAFDFAAGHGIHAAAGGGKGEKVVDVKKVEPEMK